MNLDMIIGHLRSHVFHDDQWPADSSIVTCNIDRFVMMIYINTDKLVDLAGTPQLAELSNESGRNRVIPTMEPLMRVRPVFVFLCSKYHLGRVN